MYFQESTHLDAIGFEDEDDVNECNNDKSSKKSKKGGGFQAMGLSYNVLKGILKRGYKVPTPIQRKVCFVFFKTR